MPVSVTPEFPSLYDFHFAIVRARTPELLRKAYRLRYQVYRVENPFENPDEQIDQCETDKYNDRSAHTLLVHRRTGEVAGTSRVILPHKSDPLPIATLLHGADRRGFADFPIARTAEISRFAVSKQFRRRCGEGRMPFITLGLMKGVFDICRDHKMSYLAAVMEPPLLRILRRLGLNFTPIGGLVEHHGRRQPCIAPMADLVERSRESETLLWQYAASQTRAVEDGRLAA
jgi:N-acyl amino acid synthase of PEP-CTERM/exosortase system